MALVGINNSVTEAILDTGGEKSMIDHATAERLGMRYLRAWVRIWQVSIPRKRSDPILRSSQGPPDHKL